MSAPSNCSSATATSTDLCVVCGQLLPPQKAGTRRIACAGACAAERGRQKQREHYENRKVTPEGAAQLAVNRSKAHKRWRETHAEYDRARNAAWRDANRERMAASNRAYRQENADKVRAKNQRRRARQMNAFVEDVDLEVLWERDRGVCGICHEPVDQSLAWPDKWSKTCDHIVPLAKGGEHSYANAQLAHAVCNSRKNDRILAN